MADDGDYQPLFDTKFGVILIAMGSASFVVTIYHLIFICCKHASEQTRQHEQPATQTPSTEEGSLVSHQIPSYKYEKKKRNDDNDDDDCVTCAVCLGDFEEGEELRAMPSCMHSFHVPCIDMWLLSHLNCPVCRADATPSPSPVVPHCLPEVRSAEVNVDHGANMAQIVVIQNELQNGLITVRS